MRRGTQPRVSNRRTWDGRSGRRPEGCGHLQDARLKAAPRVTIVTVRPFPDAVFESADELAHRLGISRSELYATAVAEYLAKFRGEEITARLNDVYAEVDSGLPPEVRRAQARSIGKAEW
jgi:hypothetical protein